MHDFSISFSIFCLLETLSDGLSAKNYLILRNLTIEEVKNEEYTGKRSFLTSVFLQMIWLLLNFVQDALLSAAQQQGAVVVGVFFAAIVSNELHGIVIHGQLGDKDH